jgi:hypothetical protein
MNINSHPTLPEGLVSLFSVVPPVSESQIPNLKISQPQNKS